MALTEYEGSGTANKRYYTKDHLGSIVGGSNASGASTFINAYDEYGLNASGNQGRFRYTGQMWLHEVGLYYYKARMYDPEIGRFLQTDPIGYGDGMNWYAYALNDPMNRVDPFGTTSTSTTNRCETTNNAGGCSTMGDIAQKQVDLNNKGSEDATAQKGKTNTVGKAGNAGGVTREFLKGRNKSGQTFNPQRGDASAFPPRANCQIIRDCMERLDKIESSLNLDQSLGKDPRVQIMMELMREFGKRSLCEANNTCDLMQFYRRGEQPPPLWPPDTTE